MGTRGMIGFHLNGEDRGSYNHFDSYPEELGVGMVVQAKTIRDSLAWYRELALDVAMIKDATAIPTEAERAKFDKYRGEQSEGLEARGHPEVEWYTLLRDLQGKLTESLQAGALIDGSDFILDSLFCEWAYIVNFDEGTFEVYKGCVEVGEECQGRFAGKHDPKNDYQACTLLWSCKLEDLPDDPAAWAEEMDRLAYPEDEETKPRPPDGLAVHSSARQQLKEELRMFKV